MPQSFSRLGCLCEMVFWLASARDSCDIPCIRVLGMWCLLGDQWFQLQWPDNLLKQHITAKELIPIVMPPAVWGKQWSISVVKMSCGNMAVVHIINNGYSRDPEVTVQFNQGQYISFRWIGNGTLLRSRNFNNPRYDRKLPGRPSSVLA